MTHGRPSYSWYCSLSLSAVAAADPRMLVDCTGVTRDMHAWASKPTLLSDKLEVTCSLKLLTALLQHLPHNRPISACICALELIAADTYGQQDDQ